MSYAHTKGPKTHNNPKKYYFCDKLGFDTASILYNILILVNLPKEGHPYKFKKQKS